MAVIDKTMEHEFTMVTDDDSDEGDNQPIIYQRENLSKAL